MEKTFDYRLTKRETKKKAAAVAGFALQSEALLPCCCRIAVVAALGGFYSGKNKIHQ